MTLEADEMMRRMHANDMRATGATARLQPAVLSRLGFATAALAMTTLTLGALVVLPAQIERHGTIGAIVAMWRPAGAHPGALSPATRPHAQEASSNGG